jgi:hypothetical protein
MIRRKQRKARNARRKRYNDRANAIYRLASSFKMTVLIVRDDFQNIVLLNKDSSSNSSIHSCLFYVPILVGPLPKIEQYLDRYWRMKAFL